MSRTHHLPNSFPTTQVTPAAHKSVQAVVTAAMRLGEARTPQAIQKAYTHLSMARAQLYGWIEKQEKKDKRLDRSITLRFE